MAFLGDVFAWIGDNWSGGAGGGIDQRVVEHLQISALSVLIALVVALPPAIALGHLRRGGALAINIANIGRALPSFAILVLALQITNRIGFLPTVIALVALAIPPIFTNTYVGLREVDAEIRESAAGMGMRGTQVLTRIELPMALPLIMAGIRTSAVQVVATATLATLVGWGGLGRYIIDGLATRDFQEVFAGAVLVALLSLLVEIGLSVFQRVVVPTGLQGRLVATADL